MMGHVMNIQNFSVNDGEGIRTNIFLSGCPLRCQWCANPEGQTLENSMTTPMTVEQVVAEIKKQLIFYRHSGGGVTFSGGEATVQQEFLRALISTFYDMGISLALETCGAFDFEEVSDILEKMDLIFLDIKVMDEQKHLQYTGGSNRQILENVEKIKALPCDLVIRIPVICGVNATDENMRQTFAFVKEKAPKAKVELLPYHKLGEGKYRELAMKLPPESFGIPTEEELNGWKQMAKDMGVQTISYK